MAESLQNDISLHSITTERLRAELAARQDQLGRPACGSVGFGKGYDTSLHVFALFLILFLSTFACSFPIIARRFPNLPIPHRFLFLSRHFGTGVLIATAFVHLLPTAFVSLTDPCLPPFWTEGYPASAGLIAMIAVLVVVGIEMFFAVRGAGHIHDGGYGIVDEGEEEYDGQVSLVLNEGVPCKRRLSIRHFQTSSTGLLGNGNGNGNSNGNGNGNSGGDKPFIFPPGQQRLLRRQDDDPPTYSEDYTHPDANASADIQASSSMSMSTKDGYSPSGSLQSTARNSAEMDSHHLQDPLRINTNLSTLNLNRPISRSQTPMTAKEAEEQKAVLQCFLLEAGILFHSIFIGMALSVAVGAPFIVLLVAISFHQTFEGLALGSRIAAITSFGPSSPKPWLMALCYGVTTPIGQAIGLGVHNLYDPASEMGLLMVGVMNSISSGLLLFAGLVELLAEDFLSDKSYESLRGKKRIQACVSVVAGGLLMALVGAWA